MEGELEAGGREGGREALRGVRIGKWKERERFEGGVRNRGREREREGEGGESGRGTDKE